MVLVALEPAKSLIFHVPSSFHMLGKKLCGYRLGQMTDVQ